MSVFKVGEIAVYVGYHDQSVMAPYLFERIGMECEIIGDLGSAHGKRGPQHRVKFPCGKTTKVYPVSLRKRRPPEMTNPLKLVNSGPYYHEPAHRLAMLVLQSDLYAESPDVRDAVDDVLAVYNLIEDKL